MPDAVTTGVHKHLGVKTSGLLEEKEDISMGTADRRRTWSGPECDDRVCQVLEVLGAA